MTAAGDTGHHVIALCGGVGGATEHQRFSTTIKRFLASSDAEQAHLEWLNALKDNNPQLAENWASV